MSLKSCFLASTLCLAGGVAFAQEADSSFVTSNLLGIFYHELGHAVIDLMQLPVFGQEEDAADVFSILLINEFFEEDTATALAYDTALGFLGEAEAAAGDEIAYWDVHGLDEQRFYNLVCLFYGADPEARQDFAEDLELPDDRADSCPEEFDLAYESWGAVLDEMSENGGGVSLQYQSPDSEHQAAHTIDAVLLPEIDALNAQLQFPYTLDIRVESCGEANAFYDPNDTSITLCTEFVPHLAKMAVE